MTRHISKRKILSLLKRINALALSMESLSNQELKSKMDELKEKVSNGTTLESILVEVYAIVREVDKRVLGLYPYDEQIMGAIVLHYGDIAEMKTAEGKTLTATMPLVLNALKGQCVFLLTTNEYLALRDSTDMGPVYEFFGFKIRAGVQQPHLPPFEVEDKIEIYQSDIVYTTAAHLGFDYLIDNLADSPDKKFMPPLKYAIMDEVDAILLDAAQIPLIISSSPRVQSNLYEICDSFVDTLIEKKHFDFDEEEEQVHFTKEGFEEIERFFRIQSVYTHQRIQMYRHLLLALRAKTLIFKNYHYIVQADKVKLLDRANGRILEGTKMQGGQHQALETKEKTSLTLELRAVASITYQNFFKMFDKIAGMTGTAKTEEAEFKEIYDMKVFQIPTHQTIIRKDYKDVIYHTEEEKDYFCIQEVIKVHQSGQPILLVTGSLENSQKYSNQLLQLGIAHSLLHATTAIREAEMIKEAGRVGAVTIATTMVGRGTDIKLDEKAKELGGLAVIVTERMQNKRIDLQVLGRAGRQGDPGFSRFYVSLEDRLIEESGSEYLQEQLEKYELPDNMEEVKPIESKKVYRHINRAQKKNDSSGRSSRKLVLELDESLKIQRRIIYSQRNEILSDQFKEFDLEKLMNSHLDVMEETLLAMSDSELSRYIYDHISYQKQELNGIKNRREIMMRLFKEEIETKKKILIYPEYFLEFQRKAILKAIDTQWIEQVDYLQQLKAIISSRHIDQNRMVQQYNQEAFDAFENMKKRVLENVIQNLMLSTVSLDKGFNMNIHFV